MAVYLAFSMFMATVSGKSPPVGDVARAFVYSLVPIALASSLGFVPVCSEVGYTA